MRIKNSPDGLKKPSFIETARRAQIMECAIEVIADLGYAHASLDQIARRAGISKGVISYHFNGKEELIQEIIRTQYISGYTFITSRLKTESSAAGILRAYIESDLEFMRLNPRHIIALVDIYLNDRNAAGKLRSDNATDMKNLENILKSGQESGEFREFPTSVMAQVIRSAIDAVPIQMRLHPSFDVAAYARELTVIFDLATRKS